MTRLLLFMTVLAISTPAIADPKADHLARATAAYQAGNYEEALQALTLAYAIDPDPEVVFALGQVHMKLGDCKQAIAYYQSFLATKPGATEVAVVTKAIDRCKTTKPEPVTVKPKPEAPIVAVRPVVPPPPRREQVAWYRDALGDTLVLGGIAGGVVSVLLYRSALAHRDRADPAPSYLDYVDELDASKRNQKLAIGVAGGATLLITLGMVRYARRASQREHAAISVTPISNGAVATWSSGF